MDTKSLKVFASLKQIRYSGSNIGDDLSFAFESDDEIVFLDQKIKSGKSLSIERVLWRKTALVGEVVNIDIKAVVTEEDQIFSDVGEGQTIFSYEVSLLSAKNHEFQVNVSAKGEGKKTAVFSFLIVVGVMGADYSRFDKVLEYMCQEMITNAQSKEVSDIKAELDKGKTLSALLKWRSLVKEDAVWDHKPKLKEKFVKGSDDYYFPIRNDTEHEFFYDIWSNVHYGFVGSAAGFDSITLHKYASMSSIGAGKEDEGDYLSVQIGIDLWNKYDLELAPSNVSDEILSRIQDYLEIQEKDPNVRVVIDWQDGNLK